MISLHKTENDNIYTPDVYLNKDKIMLKNPVDCKNKTAIITGVT